MKQSKGFLIRVILGAELSSLLAGCNGDPSLLTTPISSDTSGTGLSSSASASLFQKRWVSLNGRVVTAAFGADGHNIPIPSAMVRVMVDGVRYDATTDAYGFWGVPNIPVKMTDPMAGSTETNYAVYYSASGFVTYAKSPTKFEVGTAASSEVPSSNYQIDLGEQTLDQQPLEFQSNIVRGWTDNTGGGHINNGKFTTWVGSGSTVGSANGSAPDGNSENVFLASGSMPITMTFNQGVDTTRAGTKFVALYGLNNLALDYTGSWDSSGTVFTVTPKSSLTPSPFKGDKYNLKFINDIWTTGPLYKQVAIAAGTQINFNVMDASTQFPLVSQAPILAPESDSTSNVLSYSIGESTVLKNGVVTTGGLIDAIANSGVIGIRYNTTPGMTNKIYVRDVPGPGYGPSGAWTELTGGIACTSGATYADGTATCQLPNIYSLLTKTGNTVLKYGETLQFVVTTLKNTNEESEKDSVTPLTLSDQVAPYVINPTTAWNSSTSTITRPEWGTNVITGRTTIDFSEAMTGTPAAVPTLAPLSGGITTLAQNTGTGRWNSTLQYSQDLTVTFAVPTTTLKSGPSSGTYAPGATWVTVTSLGTPTSNFVVGDTVDIGPPNGGATSIAANHELLTISSIDTYNNIITFSAALTLQHSASDVVTLVDSATVNTGLTGYSSTVSTSARAGSASINLAPGDGAKFYPYQTLKFYRLDPTGVNGYLTAFSATIKSITNDTLTLTAPLSSGIAAGTIVIDSRMASPAEPKPRAAVQLTSTDSVLFDTSSTPDPVPLTNDQFPTTPDALLAEIAVSSTVGILKGDVITVAASAASSTTSAPVNRLATSVSVSSATGFRVGDLIDFAGGTPQSLTIASNSAANGSTLTVSTNPGVFAGDIIRFREGAKTATVSAALASPTGTADAVSVTSVAGFAVGQSVQFIDSLGNNGNTNVTVTAVNSNASSISVTGLTPGTKVQAGSMFVKPEFTQDIVVTANTAAGTATIGGVTFNAGTGYSTAASVSLIRPDRMAVVTAISGNTLTMDGWVGGSVTGTGLQGGFPSSTTVSLVSIPESFVVSSAPTANTIPLSGNMLYPHRSGALVTKATQAGFRVSVASKLDSVMVGDTVVIEQDTTGNSNAKKDRFQATVAALNTQTGQIALTTTQSGYFDFTALTHEDIWALGDAVQVSGHKDSNGNTGETAHGFRMSLNASGLSAIAR